jgi:beta-glucanase (GH16 family)
VERRGGNADARDGITRRGMLRAGAIGIGGVVGTGILYNLTAPTSGPADGVGAPGADPSSPPRTVAPAPEFLEAPSWTQEFKLLRDTEIDTGVWRHDLSPDVPGYNAERQAYTSRAENARVEPGLGLVLEAHRRDYQYPDDPQGRRFEYTSGRIDTRESFSFEYGRLEARMRLPRGRGVWPAFWLLSANGAHTAGREFSKKQIADKRFYLRNGEIDVMEYYGRRPGEVEATVHTFEVSRAEQVEVPDATETFHSYGAEITPTSIVWTVDGAPYYRVTKSSDRTEEWPVGNGNRFYVILNLAMGGPLAGPIDDREGPWRFEIEHVRFFDYTGG